jgi:hypothetical protein
MFKIFKAMRQADHIHLRCPGNGLLVFYRFFPSKRNSQYAGNWDPKQKTTLTQTPKKNTSKYFLTRNIQVLISRAWEGQSENCKSFLRPVIMK